MLSVSAGANQAISETKMKRLIVGLYLALAATQIGIAQANETSSAPVAEHERMSSETTPIGELLDNADARAILQRHLPDVVSSEQIDIARGMTLKTIQPYALDSITDEKLAAIDAELAELGE